MDILALIESEIANLKVARDLIAGATAKERGRPKTSFVALKKKKRKLSPEGRANIVAGQRARWASAKKRK